ncbi:hypothetical protein EG68_01099 [Paragonimus skrjabini miyazakii]|uniref:Uncharacterized protein n=1 Tax=Paragonimus skrjabini miyazakii TaxID=59628 RepID=A0A8S9ZC28_9TREM|nr:hypothetical protein EG68_01099 [Paragonimus skrjabini miyazakii]
MVSTMDMIFWVCILLVQQQLIRSETQVESYRILHLDDVMDDPKWNSNHRKFHDNDIGAFTQFALHLETNSAFLGAK